MVGLAISRLKKQAKKSNTSEPRTVNYAQHTIVQQTFHNNNY